MDYLDNPNKFREWLASLDAEHVVGYAGDPCYCPFASFLKAQGVTALIAADASDINGERFPNPDWLEKFILHVDGGGDDQDEIYAADALGFLDAVEMLVSVDEDEMI